MPTKVQNIARLWQQTNIPDGMVVPHSPGPHGCYQGVQHVPPAALRRMLHQLAGNQHSRCDALMLPARTQPCCQPRAVMKVGACTIAATFTVVTEWLDWSGSAAISIVSVAAEQCSIVNQHKITTTQSSCKTNTVHNVYICCGDQPC